MKSWKIGAIAGLIAGIVASIVATFFNKIGAFLGLWEDIWRPIISEGIIATILVTIIFGTIFGILYSKFHSVMSGKDALKGLYFGLILLTIIDIRNSTFLIPYGYSLFAAGLIFSGIFKWIVYGLILGFLYDFLYTRYYPIREKLKTISYSVGSGIFPGAIAGIADGIAASIALIVSPLIGLQIAGAPIELTLDFWISQAGAHGTINLIWGIVFGVIFARVYNLIPGKGFMKGLYYGFIIFVITRTNDAYALGFGLSSSSLFAIRTGLWSMFVGFFSTGIALGLVLGLLYRKPVK
ncbi:hypothetical protein [[Eubacterium] cellulosolvens]